MDFIEGLPISDHADTILVVVDKFSKYSHFIPLKHPFTALTVAKKFMDHVFKLHEFWYKTSYHSSLKRTPFEILYGQSPHQLGIDRVESCAVLDLATWLKERKLMVQLVQQQLIRAQQCQKVQADKHRIARSFAVGDLVYLKLQPYVQVSLLRRANHKLSFKYFGPFHILRKVGEVAYKLQLPTHSTVHPVFHVSLLKKANLPSTMVSSELPNFDVQLQVPVKILQRRSVLKDSRSIAQVLVQWSEWPPELATWEDEALLRQRFPG
ncbi:hypothetical protein BS78_09G031300, partial [Paspalum vaginatum]